MPVTGGSAVYLDGPWSHRSVSANGSRFHIAEGGVRPLAIVSAAHPLRMRAEMLAGPLRRGWRGGNTLGFQLPVLPESRLVRRNAEQVGRMLQAWSGPGWPDRETEARYRAAMVIPS